MLYLYIHHEAVINQISMLHMVTKSKREKGALKEGTLYTRKVVDITQMYKHWSSDYITI